MRTRKLKLSKPQLHRSLRLRLKRPQPRNRLRLSLRHQSRLRQSQLRLRPQSRPQLPLHQSRLRQSLVFPLPLATRSSLVPQCHARRPSQVRSLVRVRHVWQTTHFLLAPPRSAQRRVQVAAAPAASHAQVGSLVRVASSSARAATATSPLVSVRAAGVVHRLR